MHGLDLPAPGSYATGILFLDKDDTLREDSKTRFEAAAKDLDLEVMGWRMVPGNVSCLGQMASDSEPYMLQVKFHY